MSTDPKPSPWDLFPLPKGMKYRSPKFGAKPVSAFVPVPVGGDNGAVTDPRPEFKIHWEDQQQGLAVLVREGENGRLIADVFCTNAGLLGKAAVSVGLVGATADVGIRKTVPLGVPEPNGWSGAADLGLLTNAVKELGSQLGVAVFLMV